MVFEVDFQKLSDNQKRIADFVEKNVQRIAYLTEWDIAHALHISTATVSRFWRAVGYRNYKHFKSEMQKRAEISPSSKLRDFIDKVSDEDLAGSMLEKGIHCLEQTSAHLSRGAFQSAVDAMCAAETIYIYAPGPSAGVGQLLEFRLNRIGKPVRLFQKGGSELFESLINVKPTDLVVLFSFIRMLAEATVIQQYSKSVGFRTVLITDMLVSDMNEKFETVLFANRGPLSEFHSMVAPTLLAESLAVGVSKTLRPRSLEKLESLRALRKRFEKTLPR